MAFELERINRILGELSGLRYSQPSQIEVIQTKEGYFKTPEEVNEAGQVWVDFISNERWGGYDKSRWFRFDFKVGKEYENKTLIHRLHIGEPEPLGGAQHPQVLLFVNNEVRCGLDVNHLETLLTISAVEGESFTIDMQAYGGTHGKLSECINSIHVLEKEVEQLYYDLRVPMEVASHLPESNMDRIHIIEALLESVKHLDFRQPYSEGFYESISLASHSIKENLYHKLCNTNKERVVGIGHTHIDVAWLWDLNQTKQKVQRSFATVLELMDQYPEYIFMSSQPQLYDFIEQERPELMDKINARVKEGRWEAEGGMWVESDVNIPSGESLIRQILLGKEYFRNKFNKENRILWLPDVFGYSAALPQIMKKTGLDYFMTTKISWNETNQLPADTFKWVGIDGSEVLAHFITTMEADDVEDKFFTTYNGNINASSIMGAWGRYQDKSINEEVLNSYGYGDGGGGPTKEMLEMARRLEKGLPGSPVVKLGTATDFFESLDNKVMNNPKLSKWVGELYFEYHRGTLTTMAEIKKNNRLAECDILQNELLAVTGHVLGDMKYPKEELKEIWKLICLNQFHDILPGSSIKKVYEDSRLQYEHIFNSLSDMKDDTISRLMNSLDIRNATILVANPSSFNRSEVIKVDNNENQYEALAVNVPAKGFKLFTESELVKINSKHLKITKKSLENMYFKIELNAFGEITSLVDKRVDREVISTASLGNEIQIFEDKPHNWDAWDINQYYEDKQWNVNEEVTLETFKNSDFEGGIKVVKRFSNSTITQYISINATHGRIDFKTHVDWHETHVLMKVAFPVDIHAEKATYDIQFGNIERPTHWNTSWDKAKFEVCGHKWVDLSEHNYGVSLLNDCKYGHDVKGNIMRLTLLKSPTYPNPEADKGLHEFTYSLFPHVGNWRQGGTLEMGYRLNEPLTVIALNQTDEDKEKSSDSNCLKEFSLIQRNNEGVIIETVKEAEQGQDTICRVYEAYNSRQRTTFSLGFECSTVWLCDMEENPIEKLKLDQDMKTFTYEMKPYEIATFRVKCV